MYSLPQQLPDDQLQDLLLGGARGLDAVGRKTVGEPPTRYLASADRRARCLKELLACASEIARREALKVQLRQEMCSPQAAKDYFALHFQGYEAEAFAVMFLDASMRVLAVEELFRGTLTQTAVYPREVVKRALVHNASAVMLAHNHPSGRAEPSRADEHLTASLKSALVLVDARVLDHLVVGANAVTSMAERGLL